MRDLDSESAFSKNIDVQYFTYIGVHGEILDFSDFIEVANGVFNSAEKVEFNFSKNDVRVLSRDIALVTYLFNGTFFFEDSKLFFPDCASSYVMRKRKMVGK